MIRIFFEKKVGEGYITSVRVFFLIVLLWSTPVTS